MNNNITLKPCPFCAGEAKVEYGYCDYNVYQVICSNNDCRGMAGWNDTPKEAINAWNKRILAKSLTLSVKISDMDLFSDIIDYIIKINELNPNAGYLDDIEAICDKHSEMHKNSLNR